MILIMIPVKIYNTKPADANDTNEAVDDPKYIYIKLSEGVEFWISCEDQYLKNLLLNSRRTFDFVAFIMYIVLTNMSEEWKEND